ncbi:MAG: sodium/solute symporter [Planctomycetota bacterium]
MNLQIVDIIVFVIFAAAVVGIGLWKSRGEKETAEDYFLAGRGLTWPLIGFSLIAANISAEQMVGMSGAAANSEMGFAIASYEWMAAITLVVVGFTFLPTFLKSGIYTIPQFLDYRYGPFARTVMSLLMFITFVLVNISTVTYLGAKFLDPYVDLGGSDITVLSWGVGIIAAVYIAVGGLKASAWADLIQGSALIVGGAVVTIIAIGALGSPDVEKGMNDAATVAQQLGVTPDAGIGERLGRMKEDSMHMFLPKTHDAIPWTALIIGLWIPNFYYWGLNQYIVQRTLGSKTLAEGQKGIVFAAALKLVIPFVVCVPGIIAFTLYSGKMAEKADIDTNNAIVEVFRADPGDNLFPFRDDFAERDYVLAEQIFTHNLSVVGEAAVGDRSTLLANAEGNDPQAAEPRTPGEVLAVANDVLLGGAPADAPRQPLLVGYDYDDAFPVLVKELVPIGLKGFVIAAVMGAVVSSLASMMNAASTIFTMDLYNKFLNKDASQKQLVWTGRAVVVASMIVGCLVAPFIANPNLRGAFNFIQEFQGFISPGILTIFLFGLFVPRAPKLAGVVGLVLSPVIYGALKLVTEATSFEQGSLGNLLIDPFLNRMAITIVVISIVLGIMTAVMPLKEPLKLPENEGMDVQGSGKAKMAGIVVIALTVLLYIIFA